MAGLGGGFKNLFDAALIPGAAPGGQQVANGVESQHLLQRHGDIRSDDLIEGHVKDGVFCHKQQGDTMPATAT